MQDEEGKEKRCAPWSDSGVMNLEGELHAEEGHSWSLENAMLDDSELVRSHQDISDYETRSRWHSIGSNAP